MSSIAPERWQRIEEVFSEAVELNGADRTAFLERACGTDSELRAELDSLLASVPGASEKMHGAIAFVAGEVTAPSLVGRGIGPYRVVEVLGEGGMGVVYRAERDDAQYKREVAIKILHGLGSPQAIARFRDERQILAKLDHPGIVRLLDGGSTDDGLPYLVMERIEGEPITRHARARELSIRERVELGVRVCDALQYAHAKLVVHRDIKPSNILVDRTGIPKLLDFGIARLDESDREARTRTGMAQLTPEYASPEQARGESVSVATDVYSLGAVLYELLAEQPAQRAIGGPLEWIKAITEVEPPRPSTVAPPGVRREIAGDLDRIVLKALAKEPARRYATIEQLGDDLRRYLDGMPVIARAPTVGYRAGKFVRRHSGKLAIALLVVVALTIATITSLQQARHAERARVTADIARVQAQSETQRARDMLLVATAQRLNDPTVAVALLREVSDPQSTPGWMQAAVNAMVNPIATGVFTCPVRAQSAVFDAAGERVAIGCWASPAWVMPMDALARSSSEGHIRIDYEAKGDQPKGVQLQFGPGGQLLTNPMLSNLKLWDLARPSTPVWESNGPGWVEINRPGTTLVRIGENPLLQQIGSNEPPIELVGHTDFVVRMSVSDDGRTIATSSNDGTVRVWHPGGAPPVVLRIQAGGIWLSGNARRVLTQSTDGARVWDLDRPGTEPRFFAGDLAKQFARSPIDPTGSVVLNVAGGTATLWNLDAKTSVSLGQVTDRLDGPLFHPDGKRVLTWTPQGLVQIWNYETGVESRFQLTQTIVAANFDPSGRHLVTASLSGTVRLVPLDELAGVVRYKLLRTTGAVFSPDGALLYVGSMSGGPGMGDGRYVQETLVMRRDGHVIARRTVPATFPRTFEFSPDGTRLLTQGGSDAEFLITSLDLSNPVLLPVPGERALFATFAAGGKEVITVSVIDGPPPMNVQRVRRWSLDGTPKQLSEIAIEQTSLELITNDRLIGPGFDDNKQVRIFDHAGTLVATFHSDGMAVANALSRDGTTVATGSESKKLHIWRIDQPDKVLVQTSPGTPLSVAFTPDGRHVIGASGRGMYAWRTDVVADPLELPAPCNAVRVSLDPAGRSAAVACEGGEMAVMPLPPLDTPAMTDAMWKATSHCIPADERRRLLGETESDAAARFAACKQRAAR